MGCDRSRYELTVISGAPENFDFEYFMYRLLKDVSEAGVFLNDAGKSTGNDGDWATIVEDMKAYSKTCPDLTILIEEEIVYGGEVSYTRFYFKNWESHMLSPKVVVTWPEFTGF